ncbi:MAG: cupin domain-containing protein [Solirubrobacteraceae bacterium]
MAEAKLAQQEGGLAPVDEGWFVVNVSEGAWVTSPAFGSECVFEVERGTSFKDVGMSVAVLTPGRPNGLYHREINNQEDFLVLSGEYLLLIEGEERALKTWDFVHCPPGTDHIFVGAGDGPCVLFMVGARKERATVYPRSELALRHRASAEVETPSSRDAYAPYPPWQPGGAEIWKDVRRT